MKYSLCFIYLNKNRYVGHDDDSTVQARCIRFNIKDLSLEPGPQSELTNKYLSDLIWYHTVIQLQAIISN